MKLDTVRELLKALPEEVKLGECLQHNLVHVGLLMDGLVFITGSKEGRLQSENTTMGSDWLVSRLIEELNKD